MPANHDEIERRKNIALAAIRSALAKEEDDYGAKLFVSHHLDEIEETYWQKHLGAARPEPSRVLDILELQSHWSVEEDDGIETFDFTLPEDVTNYVISVHFNESGQVEEITMES
jgi:hypothetical protein